MSYDLCVYLNIVPTIANLRNALNQKNCFPDADIENLEDHTGCFPIKVKWRKEFHDEGPELYFDNTLEMDPELLEYCSPAQRKKLKQATCEFSVCGDAGPGSWALAAALCATAQGVIFDPQSDQLYTPSAAWKLFSESCREEFATLPSAKGKTAEQRFIEKMRNRYPTIGERDLEESVDYWRKEQRDKRGDRILKPLVADGNNESLEEFLVGPDICAADIEDLLLLASRNKNLNKGKLIINHADSQALTALAHKHFYAQGVSSRVFIEFLMAAGLACKLPMDSRDALLERCVNAEIKHIVLTAFS